MSGTLSSLSRRLTKLEQQLADRAKRANLASCNCSCITIADPARSEEFEAEMNLPCPAHGFRRLGRIDRQFFYNPDHSVKRDPQSEQAELVPLLEQELNRTTWDRIAKSVASWDEGPLLWATQYTMSEDSHWLAKGTEFRSPFPRWPYLLEVMRLLFSEPTLFIWKSREMMMSWLVTLYIAWMCQWRPVFWVAQTAKEDKVRELINYARILHTNQPEWMRRRNPLVADNGLELKWANGGRFLGIVKGADQIRIHHPYGYFQDESAFLPEAEASFNAVRPVARKMICVSSDEMGWFHDCCKLEQ